MKREQILVVDANVIIDKIGIKSDGLIRIDENTCKKIITDNCKYEWRDLVETNPMYRQIISYCMIIYFDSIFLVKRTKNQTEKRLHDLYSVGIGGHISICDQNTDDIVKKGMIRELEEEVNINSSYSIEFDGVINDDSSPVSSVHTALCYQIVVNEPNCIVRETDKMTGEWVKIKELSKYKQEMETWSICYLRSKNML